MLTDDQPVVRVKRSGEIRMNLAAFALLDPQAVVKYLRGIWSSPFIGAR